MNNYFPYNRKPHYYETDMMGVIHHSNYIRWFEEARLDFLEQAGFAYLKMEEEGVIIPVLAIDIKYHNFVRYEEEVSIFVKLINYSGVKLKLGYEIYRNRDNLLCTTGTTDHTFIGEDKKILRLKKSHEEVHQFFFELMKASKGFIIS